MRFKYTYSFLKSEKWKMLNFGASKTVKKIKVVAI